MQSTKLPTLSAIAAISENRVIGLNNQLPWHLPADLKHFKSITTGHPIVMGRKTYDSIGRPLPNRLNIVLSRDQTLDIAGCIVISTIDSALKLAAKEGADELFIIGGAEIYRQLLPSIQRLYLTVVHHSFEGDAFFPELNDATWKEISRERHEKDEQNPFAYSFIVLERV